MASMMDDPQDGAEMELGNESDDEKKTGDKKGRRKIKIELIEDKSRRHITFSKRKLGIMKKAWELATLTGTQVLLLVASETGHVYTFATPKLQPLITKPEGKNLIQACLNAPDPVQVQPAAMTPPRAQPQYTMPAEQYTEDVKNPGVGTYPGMARPVYPAGYQATQYTPPKGQQYFQAGTGGAVQAPADGAEGQ